MIKVQHEHEEQWWAGRQDLLKRQASRKESQRKLDEVLYVPAKWTKLELADSG